MLKRLGIGFLKGLVVGVAIGAGLHFGLHWPVIGDVLGYLLAMAAGATAGILSGKPPWREGAGIEAALKGIGGVGIAALLYYLAQRFAGFGVPFGVLGIPAGTLWTHVPLLVAPAIAALFATFVELDNNADKKRDSRPKTRLRVDSHTDEDLLEPLDESKVAKKKA